MSIVVVRLTKLYIIVLTTPLDGLAGIAVACYFSVRGIGVACADVAVFAIDFTDILGKQPDPEPRTHL